MRIQLKFKAVHRTQNKGGAGGEMSKGMDVIKRVIKQGMKFLIHNGLK